MSIYNKYYKDEKIELGDDEHSCMYHVEMFPLFDGKTKYYKIYFDDHLPKRVAVFFTKQDAEYYADCFNRLIESQLEYLNTSNKYNTTPFRIVKAKYSCNLLVVGRTAKGNWVTMDVSHTLNAARQFIQRAVRTSISPDCWQMPIEADPVELQITELPGV